MPATTLQATVRYLPPGIRQVYKVPTLADPTNPTRVELDAGTDITDEVVDGGITGFSYTPSQVDAGDVGSKLTKQVKGRTALDAPSLNLYLSEDYDGTTNKDARDLWADDEAGFVVIFPEGDHDGLTLNVYQVTALATVVDPDTTKVANCTVSFVQTGLPALNVTIPASA